jgi:hypothetical protein
MMAGVSQGNTRLYPDDPRHGTPNGYGNLGCRCAACREANRVNHARYMAKVRAEARILGEHGKSLAYDSGCRCEGCRTAHNAKSRAYKAKLRAAQHSSATS